MNDIDNRIAEVSRLINSYCRAHTSNQFDAEDMAQDILLALTCSLPDLRDERAFYGFMWSVAGNVCRQWYRRKYRCSAECAIDDIDIGNAAAAAEPDTSEDIALLRRELALLNARMRRATVMYYIEGRRCAEIASLLGESESNVKYLLFRSRRIIREGMNMERTNGELSYDPKRLELRFWGDMRASGFELGTRPISQNILLACLNDRLTGEEISLEIGVGLPYMENELEKLVELGLVIRDSRRYTTNIPVITRDMWNEIQRSTAGTNRRIADMLAARVPSLIPEARSIGFVNCDMPETELRWQLILKVLHSAVTGKLMRESRMILEDSPIGKRCRTWAVEENPNISRLGIANLHLEAGSVHFRDSSHFGNYVHHIFFSDIRLARVFIAIAAGNTSGFGDTDREIAAEIVRMGYIRSDVGGLKVNAPVFTSAQYSGFCALTEPLAEDIYAAAKTAQEAIGRIFKNHLPVHLRRLAETMSSLMMLGLGISAPIDTLVDDGFLISRQDKVISATTHIVLK